MERIAFRVARIQGYYLAVVRVSVNNMLCTPIAEVLLGQGVMVVRVAVDAA